MNDRLYRSRDERVIGGVAGGLADYVGIDPTIVRVLWVLLAVLSGGAFIVIYIVMLFVVPEDPVDPMLVADAATMSDRTAATDTSAAAGSDWRALRAAERARRREERARTRREAGAMRNERGPIVVGLILVVLGGWFLLQEYFPAFDWDKVWPLLLIGVGVVILLGALRRDRDAGGPTTPAP